MPFLKIRSLILVGIVLSLAGCASHGGAGSGANDYGFWSGLWHGFIFVFAVMGVAVSWLASLAGVEFLANVAIIGRPNTGWSFYYVGFVLGLLASLGSRASTNQRGGRPNNKSNSNPIQ